MEEEYVEFISQTSVLNAITLEEVQAATAKDKVFQTVINYAIPDAGIKSTSMNLTRSHCVNSRTRES